MGVKVEDGGSDVKCKEHIFSHSDSPVDQCDPSCQGSI